MFEWSQIQLHTKLTLWWSFLHANRAHHKKPHSPASTLWKWHHWKSISFCLWPQTTCTWNLRLKFQSKLALHSRNHTAKSRNQKIQDGHQAAILKTTSLEINKLLPKYTSKVLTFQADIQSQIKVRDQKPKDPNDHHFESKVLENH